MKIISIVFGCVLLGCTASQSTETSSTQDTINTNLTGVAAVPADSTATVSLPVSNPLVISDSSSNALNDLMTAQFEKVYKELADSANYYKVTLEDYYDEYEGQDVLSHTTWYFDKEFSIVYATHDDQTGAMERPFETEYLLRNGSIVCTREDSDTSNKAMEQTIILWDRQAGGVRLSLKRYGETVITKEATPANYGTTLQNSWEVNFSKLESMLEEDASENADGVYTIRIEVPKASELRDYTEVTIPKVVYDKLRQP